MKFESRDELEAWREYVLTMLNRGDFWDDVHHRADRFIEMERERAGYQPDGSTKEISK